MVLFLAAGWAGSTYLGIRLAFPVMAILGLVVANLVPARTACSTGRPRDHAGDADTGDAEDADVSGRDGTPADTKRSAGPV